MTRLLSFFLLLPIITATKVWACDCDYGGPFLKMAPRTQFVALVKVIKYLTFKDIYGHKTPMSMEVEIIDTYKGLEERKIITVWGDPGHLCRPYLSTFKEGEYYVIAFFPGHPNSGHENEKVTDYSVSNCGAFWLTVDYEKQTALGDIDSEDRKSQSFSLSSLKFALKKNDH
ncbi:MAG TPA: hypothetical protein VIY47_01905 [Ignavibacteriaceae bacterium]